MNKTKIFDQELKEFIRKWEYFEYDNKYTAIKRSLTYYITQAVYKKCLDSNLCNSEVIKKRWLRRFTQGSQFIYHVLFYCFYSIKWLFILNSNNNSNFIFIYLLPNKLSSHYIDAIKEIDVKLIHFGIRTETKYLFDKNFFCFPIFFYRRKVNQDELNRIFSKIKISLSLSLNSTFPNIKCDNFELRNELFHSISMFEVIEKFFKIFSKKGNIRYLLQDMDFMALGHLLVEISNQYKVESIAIDHAITLYNHMYFNRPSDKFFVWGKYEKDRLIDKFNIDEKKIFVIGHPFKEYKEQPSSKSIKKNIWLYLMQSYNYPIYFSMNRTYENSIENILRLYKEFIKVHDDGKFIVKLHPLDKISNNDFIEDRLIFTNELFLDNYDEIELIVFEDTSSAIDCLQFDILWYYVSVDNINAVFEKMNTVPKIYSHKEISSHQFENDKLDYQDKKDIFQYFYGNYKNISMIIKEFNN